MEDFSPKFSVQDAMKYMQTPAGKQLISLLQQSNDESLKKARQLAAKGDTQAAADCLKDFTGSAQIQELLRQMGGK